MKAKTAEGERLKDFERNREGRLSSRQWLQLITEPLTALMLLSVPLIVLVGRFGVAGRVIVLAVAAGFGLTIGLRAIRFARAKLCYRIVFAEERRGRWRFWRRTVLTSKAGEEIRFDHRLAGSRKVEHNQALQAYYTEVAGRRILLSVIPQRHPLAAAAEPSERFVHNGGRIHSD